MNQTGKIMRFYVKDCAGSDYIRPAGYPQPLAADINNMVKFTKSVKLNVNKDLFFKSQFSIQGVNYELSPIIHMTASFEWNDRPLTEAPVNEKLFNSIILLYGFILIDIHHLSFKKIFKNGFREASSSVLMKHWNHCRKIESFEQGCLLTDEISFSTRIPFSDVVIRPIYSFVFKHRHERLKRKFGSGS
jgi:hypothetical protein